jgi:hypothetical protein
MSQIRINWWWVLPIILLAIGLAGQFLLYDTLWFDEVMTYFITGIGNFAPRSLDNMLFVTASDNSWPPAYFLMALVWNFLTGESLFLNRVLPLLIGVLSLAMMFRVGKAIFNQRVGVYASLILGTSTFYLFYFHEMRGYSLYVLISLIHLWIYWILLTIPHHYEKRYLRWFFAFATAFTLYSHYVAIVSVGTLGLYHIFFERKNKNWLGILKLSINGSIFFGPWIAVTVVSIYNHSLTEWHKFDEAMGGVLVSFSNGLIIPFIFVMLSSLLLWKRHKAVSVLWIWSFAVIVFIGLGNLYAQFIFHPRHMIILLIPVCLLIAYLVHRLENCFPALGFGILLIWSSAGVYHASSLDFIYNLPGQMTSIPLNTMNQAVDIGEQCVMANDAVVFAFSNQNILDDRSALNNTMLYYYFKDAPFRYSQLYQMESIEGIITKNDNVDPDYPGRIDTFVGNSERVWFMLLPSNPTLTEIQYQFETHLSQTGFTRCGVFAETPDLVGIVYAKDLAQCEVIMNSCNEN